MASSILFHLTELSLAYELFLQATPRVKRGLASQMLEFGKPFSELKIDFEKPSLTLTEHRAGSLEIPDRDPISFDVILSPINLHPQVEQQAFRHIFDLNSLVRLSDWHSDELICPLCRRNVIALSLVMTPDRSTRIQATHSLFQKAFLFKETRPTASNTLEIVLARKDFLEVAEDSEMIDQLQLLRSPCARLSLRTMSLVHHSFDSAPKLSFLVSSLTIASSLFAFEILTGPLGIPSELKILVFSHGLVGFMLFKLLTAILDQIFLAV